MMGKTIVAIGLFLFLLMPLMAQDPAGAPAGTADDSAAKEAEAVTPPPISRQNWGSVVGFAPDVLPEGYQVGLTIDASNLETWASIVPHPVATLVKSHGLKLKTRDYASYAPSDGYIASTKRNLGKTRLVEIGSDWETKGIEDYAGGLPFPSPENGRQVAWNSTLAYGGDDGITEFSVYWIDGKRGVERNEIWKTTSIRTMYRNDIEPMPDVQQLASQEIVGATLTQALSPMDKKGYSSLYYGYKSMKEPSGWVYIPNQRRSLKFSFGLSGESWNNTDLFYEDIRGYTGRPEWMNWKIVEKTTALLPMHAGVTIGKDKAETVYDFKTAPHWNPSIEWEPRPVYLLEATPKTPDYPYSRMLLWVDAESWFILAKSAYDRKGNLWKVVIGGADASDDPAKLPPKPAINLVVDLQARHATVFFWNKQEANTGIDPDLFQLSTLRKMGR